MEAEEFTHVLDTVRSFVRNEVVPAEDEIEKTDQIPAHIKEASADMGLFGFAIPEEYGGLGVTMTEEAEQIGRAACRERRWGGGVGRTKKRRRTRRKDG